MADWSVVYLPLEKISKSIGMIKFTIEIDMFQTTNQQIPWLRRGCQWISCRATSWSFVSWPDAPEAPGAALEAPGLQHPDGDE